jgi:hypothetical protein
MVKVMHVMCDAVEWSLRTVAIVGLAAGATAAAVFALFVARLLSMLGPVEELW